MSTEERDLIEAIKKKVEDGTIQTVVMTPLLPGDAYIESVGRDEENKETFIKYVDGRLECYCNVSAREHEELVQDLQDCLEVTDDKGEAK